MALPKIKDIKHLTDSEIQKKIIEIKKEIFDLKLKQTTRQNIKSHLFKHKKHQLAQLLTIKQN
uniref:ribosomal protein L29 n=1 Tax=Gracilaria flabelliformis subsp. simplex TaxID=1638138 RepID=UPI001D12B153|nr:ribosomal protein L29 [Gracilaria flabelliformis subsp. simplex]UAD86049.1 ribosomal protein L29 [Gracilaria flabelliformis subsp. simplex]